MINLIPNQEKKKMIHGFYYKLATMFFAMLSLSLGIGLFALLPSYFLSVSKNNAAKEALIAQKNIPPPPASEENLAAVADLNKKLGLLERAQNEPFVVSEKVINAVLLKKPASVTITQMSYENNSPNNSQSGRKISIRGTAISREVLLSFRQALEDDPLFDSVDLPISNFIKGSDLQFYITLIPAHER